MKTHLIRAHAARTRLAAIAGATLLASACLAQDGAPPTSVDDALDRALRAVADDPNLSSSTREAMSNLLEAMQQDRVQKTAAETVPPVAPPQTGVSSMADTRSLLERVKVSGDLRFRHESSWLDMREDRHRQRLRFRLGAELDVADDLLIGARITTGDPDDPRSPYQTLGNDFDKFDLSFDRIFATWKPDEVPGLFLTGGKFGHPFYSNPIYGELVWDADVQPEGLAAGYTMDGFLGLDSFKVVGGAYNIFEQGAGDDARAFVIQASGSEDLGNDWLFSFGVGYYYYGNQTPDGSGFVLADNRGNAVVDTNGDTIPDDFASDFGIFNPIIAIQHRGDIPITFSAEYILNTRANMSDDTGYALGVAAGQSRKKGDWQGYYQWQDIEQDAVFTPFNQDDFLQATAFRGHVFGVKYRFTDNVELHAWSLVSEPESGVTDEDWRFRLDLTISF